MTEEEDAGKEEDVQLLAEMPLQEYKEGNGRWLLRCDEEVRRGVKWPPPTAPDSAEAGAPRTILRMAIYFFVCYVKVFFFMCRQCCGQEGRIRVSRVLIGLRKGKHKMQCVKTWVARDQNRPDQMGRIKAQGNHDVKIKGDNFK